MTVSFIVNSSLKSELFIIADAKTSVDEVKNTIGPVPLLEIGMSDTPCIGWWSSVNRFLVGG